MEKETKITDPLKKSFGIFDKGSEKGMLQNLCVLQHTLMILY